MGPAAGPLLRETGELNAGLTGFYYLRDYRGLREAVVRIVYGRWTTYMLTLAGIDGQPFHLRPRLGHEVLTLENGHPFAWLYRDPESFLLHEAHYLDAEQLIQLRQLFEQHKLDEKNRVSGVSQLTSVAPHGVSDQ